MSGRLLGRVLTPILEQLFAAGPCLGCGCQSDAHDSLCACCRRQLRLVPNPCRHCGQPNPLQAAACPACLLDPPRWQRLVAPLRFAGLTRDYLHQFKYAEALHLVRPLGRRWLDSFAPAEMLPEVLLPVPLHPSRLRERGFNQADEIARLWARALSLPIERDVLVRERPAPSQSGLSARQRAANVRGVFGCNNAHGYRHVAVVDDVVTTGSTANEITRQLHRAGVEFVEIWALARAYRD